MATTVLVKDLHKIDGECRSLRNSVIELERAQRLENSRGKMLTAAPELGHNGAGRKKSRSLLLPMDAVDAINRRAGELSLLVKEHKELLREREKLASILSDTSVQVKKAITENKDFKQRIGQTEDKTIFHVQGSVKNAARVNQLKFEVIKALQDRECIQETLKRQTENLKGYVNEYVSTKDFNERYEAAASQLREKKEKLESIRANIFSMQRVLEEKERQLAKEKPVDELAIALSMERDRRVALHKLEKAEEGVRANEMSIRYRVLQIAKLEKRIEMIGDALARNYRFADGRADAGQVDDLFNKISLLNGKMNEMEAQLNGIDSEIVDLERRSSGLTRSTENSRKEIQRILQRHEKIKNIQSEEFREEQLAAEEEIGEIVKEIEALRQLKLIKQRPSRC